jgi:hypothetical protein
VIWSPIGDLQVHRINAFPVLQQNMAGIIFWDGKGLLYDKFYDAVSTEDDA